MRSAAREIKSCPLLYKLLSSLKQEFEAFWFSVSKSAVTLKLILWTHLCKIWLYRGVQLGSNDLEFVLSLEFVLVARPSETVQRSCVYSPGRDRLKELPELQRFAVPLLEGRKFSSGLGISWEGVSWKRVKFRLVAFLFCILELSHCLLSLLDCLIDQKC